MKANSKKISLNSGHVLKNIMKRLKYHIPIKQIISPEICSKVQKFGGKAEIVSEMELFLAQKLGVPPCQIIFNGPIKTSASVKEVLLGGGIINIDSKLDLELVLSAAPLIQAKTGKVALRLNFDIEGSVSRFGIDVNDPEIDNMISRIQQHGKLNLIGVHLPLPLS